MYCKKWTILKRSQIWVRVLWTVFNRHHWENFGKVFLSIWVVFEQFFKICPETVSSFNIQSQSKRPHCFITMDHPYFSQDFPLILCLFCISPSLAFFWQAEDPKEGRTGLHSWIVCSTISCLRLLITQYTFYLFHLISSY